MLIAIAHILGAIVAYIVIGLAIAFVSMRWHESSTRRAYEELAVRFGITPDQAKHEDEAHTPRINQFFAERSSSELLRNRFSDLCGIVLMVWNFLAMASMAGWVLGVIWFSITESSELAIQAWWILLISLGSAVIGTAFAVACYLLTGRTPGEAQRVRKHLATVVRREQSE